MSNFKNILLNAIYQVFLLLVPIVTLPYVARVLGASNLGIYSSTTAVIVFLGVIINFGLNQLGSRKIAQANQFDRLSVFFDLWKLQFASGIVVTALYILCIFLFSDETQIYLTQLLYLLSFIFDISWYFIGLGQIQKVVLRNTVVKLIGVALIFLFVKNKDQLLAYILINGGTFFASNIFFWTEIGHQNKELKVFNSKPMHPFRINLNYARSAFLLMMPQIAVQVYTSLDKPIVRAMSNNVQVSYYDQSQKIARMVIAIVSSASVVLMPKMAGSKDKLATNKMFEDSLYYTSKIAFIATVVVCANSFDFVPWFFGEKYAPMALNMFIASLIILFISLGGVFSNQLALALGLDKIFAIPYYVGAVFNLVLNYFLTLRFASIGASVALVLTEAIVLTLRVSLLHRHLHIFEVFRSAETLQNFLAAVASLLVGFLPLYSRFSSFVAIVIRSVLMVVTYLVVLNILRSTIYKRLGAILVSKQDKLR